MLNFMRSYSKSVFVKILLGIIIIVFAVWGIYATGDTPADQIAIVNGEKITPKQFSQMYEMIVQQLQNYANGQPLDESVMKSGVLEQQALQMAISRALLRQEAQKIGIKVTDKELQETIAGFSAFQENGVLNKKRYETELQRKGISPEEFESGLRTNIYIEKLLNIVQEVVAVSDAELRQVYNLQMEQVRVGIVPFMPTKYTTVKVTNEDAKTYFDKNKMTYQEPAKVKAQYVVFSDVEYAKKVSLSDADVREFYKENRATFETPAKFKTRHILIRMDQSATPEMAETAYKKAIKAYDEVVNQKKSFAEVAKKYSEDTNREQGGELPEMPAQAFVKSFADAIMALKEQEISKPVRTEYGWHVIQLQKKTPAQIVSFEKIAPSIRATLVREKARNLAYEDASAFQGAVSRGKSFASLAKERNLTIYTTDYITATGPIGMPEASKFGAIATNLQKNAVSAIQEMPTGQMIIQTIDKKPAAIPTFEAVKMHVIDDVTLQQQKKRAREDADKFLATLKKGTSLPKALKDFGVQIQSTPYFPRNVQQINPEILDVAFSLSPKHMYGDKIVQDGDLYLVIIYGDRRKPSEEQYKVEKMIVLQAIRNQKMKKVQDDLLTLLVKNAEIKQNEKAMEMLKKQ